MLKGILVGLALMIGASWALADAREDCLQDKDADLRIRGCSDIISGDGRDALAYYKRGVAYQDKHEHDRAIADYTKAIEINPQYGDAYFNRGTAYHSKRDYDRAFADLNKAIEINPQDGDAYQNRGIAYHDK